MSTKTVWKIIGVLALILVSMWFWSTGSELISAKNSVEVVIGFSVLLLLIGTWASLIIGFVKKMMKGKSSTVVLALMTALVLTSSGCTRIDPGHAGIKVNMYGTNKGVADYPLVTGRVWYNPFTETVFQYPCFVQTAVWTKDANEGSPHNEEISFNSGEGLVITGDISLSYQLEQAKVPEFYVKFRSDKIDTFTHGYLRNVARDAFNEVASTMKVDEIYGKGKDEMLKQVRAKINEQVNPYGIHIEQFGFVGAPRLPQNVIDAINAKIKALQDAIRTENEVQTAKAQAEKDVAKADGEGRAKVQVAKGEAEANLLLTKSITPELIQWRQLQITKDAIDKWDGRRPMVESGGGGGLLLQLPSTVLTAQAGQK